MTRVSSSARIWRPRLLAVLAGLIALGPLSTRAFAQEIEGTPRVLVGGIPFDLMVVGSEEESALFRIETAQGRVMAQGEVGPGGSEELAGLVIERRAELPIRAVFEQTQSEISAPFVPGWFSLLPPLLAIALALVFREVVISLFAGVWLGALAVSGFNPVTALWEGGR